MNTRAKNLISVLHIRVRIHSTWYLAFILITGVLVTWFPEDYPLSQRIILGVTGSLLFLVSMGIRQLLLDFLAIFVGIPLKNVTLFVFGGTTQVPQDTTRPAGELIVAAGGLLLNLIIAGIFNWAYLGQSSTDNAAIVGLLQWLAFFWYMLALLHFLPGFPLGSGRILLAIVWKATKDYVRAIRITTWLGWGIGVLLTLGGIYLLVISRQTVNGLLLAFLGWALQAAATQSRRRAMLLQALQNTRAADITTSEFPSVAPELSLGQVVRDYILVNGQDYFTVAERGKLLGIVTADNMKHLPREQWGVTPIRQIMTPARKVKTVQADKSGAHLLEQMDQSRTDEMPVLANDELIGIVVRDSLIRLARIRADLRI